MRSNLKLISSNLFGVDGSDYHDGATVTFNDTIRPRICSLLWNYPSITTALVLYFWSYIVKQFYVDLNTRIGGTVALLLACVCSTTWLDKLDINGHPCLPHRVGKIVANRGVCYVFLWQWKWLTGLALGVLYQRGRWVRNLLELRPAKLFPVCLPIQ